MTLLVQITDTHVVERGMLLYGMADKSSNMGWEDLKDRMRGSIVVKNLR